MPPQAQKSQPCSPSTASLIFPDPDGLQQLHNEQAQRIAAKQGTTDLFNTMSAWLSPVLRIVSAAQMNEDFPVRLADLVHASTLKVALPRMVGGKDDVLEFHLQDQVLHSFIAACVGPPKPPPPPPSEPAVLNSGEAEIVRPPMMTHHYTLIPIDTHYLVNGGTLEFVFTVHLGSETMGSFELFPANAQVQDNGAMGASLKHLDQVKPGWSQSMTYRLSPGERVVLGMEGSSGSMAGSYTGTVTYKVTGIP